jgi:hypothetical protein
MVSEPGEARGAGGCGLTLAAADAKIWGGWRVGVGAWGKGRCKLAPSRAAELKLLGRLMVQLGLCKSYEAVIQVFE